MIRTDGSGSFVLATVLFLIAAVPTTVSAGDGLDLVPRAKYWAPAHRQPIASVLLGGLEWEKKDDGGGLHDKDSLYVWYGYCPGEPMCGGYAPDNPPSCTFPPPCQPTAAAVDACLEGRGSGCASCASGELCSIPEGAETTVWGWLAALNRAERSGLARRRDWRLPEVGRVQGAGVPGAFELDALYREGCDEFPCIGREFDTRCRAGCTIVSCSCTGDGPYLSANTHLGFGTPVTLFVQGVWFRPDLGDGLVGVHPDQPAHARAVRDAPPSRRVAPIPRR